MCAIIDYIFRDVGSEQWMNFQLTTTLCSPSNFSVQALLSKSTVRVLIVRSRSISSLIFISSIFWLSLQCSQFLHWTQPYIISLAAVFTKFLLLITSELNDPYLPVVYVFWICRVAISVDLILYNSKICLLCCLAMYENWIRIYVLTFHVCLKLVVKEWLTIKCITSEMFFNSCTDFVWTLMTHVPSEYLNKES